MQTKRRKRNFSSTSVQLSDEQFDSLEEIILSREDRPSNAQILREAFDFYIEQKYPQFKK